ncbi:2072_t:CDS:2, partial [Racocetra persica]
MAGDITITCASGSSSENVSINITDSLKEQYKSALPAFMVRTDILTHYSKNHINETLITQEDE